MQEIRSTPRLRALLLVSALGALILGGCAHGRGEPASPDSPSATVRAFHRALEERALDRLVGLHAEDVVLMPPASAPVRGREAVRRLYREQFERFRSRFRLELSEVVESPDWAFARGSLEVAATTADGSDSFSTTIGFVMILRPAGGDAWQITRHIWNLQEPVPQELPPHP